MEPFLARKPVSGKFHLPAPTDPVHFLLLKKEGELPCVALGMERRGNGHHRYAFPLPSSTTGPSCRAASSLGAPGQLLSMPPDSLVLAERKERMQPGQTAGEARRKPSRAGGNALAAATLPLQLAFP